jgi:hypothetical protein
MARLEELTTGTAVRGVSSSGTVTVVSVQWHGNDVVTLTYKDARGQVDQQLIYRDDEPTLEVVMSGRPWDFDGDGHLFRLVSETHRIRMAYLFDPLLAVHTSLVEPLPIRALPCTRRCFLDSRCAFYHPTLRTSTRSSRPSASSKPDVDVPKHAPNPVSGT